MNINTPKSNELSTSCIAINYKFRCDEVDRDQPSIQFKEDYPQIQFEKWVPLTDNLLNENNLMVAGKEFYRLMKNTEIPTSNHFLPLKELLTHKNFSYVLNRAIRQDDVFIVNAMIQQYPEEFKAELVKEDVLGLTPVFWVVIKAKNVFEVLSLMAEVAPEEFKSTVDKLDNRGNTYLSVLVHEHALKTVQFLAEFAPFQFRRALRLPNEEGETPVALAVTEEDIKMLKVMAKHGLDEFKYAMTKQNENNETPVSMAYTHTGILKYMHSLAPQEFQLASTMRDDSGMSILDLIKKRRPKNYREISKLYNKNTLIKRINKEIFKRIALSHFYEVTGTSDVIVANTNRYCASFNLEGWRSPQWFNIIEKDLHHFFKAYPYSLEMNEMDLLLKACRFEADHSSYSLKERFEALKSGPAFLSTGFLTHEVTLLIWGDWFVICNRGETSRAPLEFFRFNPKKLNFNVFSKLLDLCNGTRENYEKVLYEELPAKLGFVKTSQAKELEKNNHLLPHQSVGNCSLVSPITALYAYRLLLETREMTKFGDMDNRLMNAVDWYHTWLNFQRISVLARNIRPLENKEPFFKPDLELISECLCRAHLWNLDDVSRKKLNVLTNICLNHIDIKQQIALRIRLSKYKPIEGQLLF